MAALEERILGLRQQAAGQARVEAERVRRETKGEDPVLTRLSDANADLSREIDELTAATGEMDQARAWAEQLSKRIGADRLA